MTESEQKNLAKLLANEGWGLIPPNQYLRDLDDKFLNAWGRVQPYTMISPERGWALAEALRYVVTNEIPGDIVECGVWKGGACLLASLILEDLGDANKTIWLYDTFEGMTDPGPQDRIAFTGQPLAEREPTGWWAAGTEDVKETLKQSPLPMDRFRIIAGDVEQTLLEYRPDSVSVLRLDTDWYESTKAEMEWLYPRLQSGGVLIIDDYGHFTGARKAVDEYFSSHNISPLLHRSDYTGRVLVKP